MADNSKNSRQLLMGVLFIGVALRLWQYAENRSLWLDEAYLALNLDFDWLFVLSQPLAHNQAAPVGFLLITKILADVFGHYDWVIRLVPLAGSIFTLTFAYGIARLAFRSHTGAFTFLGLVAISPLLLYYSSEFKQYATDTTVAIAALYIALHYKCPQTTKYYVGLAFAGALMVWSAFLAPFFLLATGITMMALSISKGHWRDLRFLGLTVGFWLTNFAFYYGLILHRISENTNLTSYWQSAYAPGIPTSSSDVDWIVKTLGSLTYSGFRHMGISSPFEVPQWTDLTNLLLMSTILVGFAVALTISKRVIGYLLIAFGALYIASSLSLFPLRSRPVIGVLPYFFLLSGFLVEWIARQRIAYSGFVACALALSLLLPPSLISSRSIINPQQAFDIKGALNFIKAEHQASDILLMSTWTQKAYTFYKEQFELDTLFVTHYIQTQNAQADAEIWFSGTCGILPMERVWYVVSHRYDSHKPFIETLKKYGDIEDHWERNGAAAYLINFSSAKCGQG